MVISSMSSRCSARLGAGGAVFPRASPHIILHPLPYLGASLQLSGCISEQRRNFFFWRRCRGLDPQARVDRRCQRARDRAEYIYLKRARRLGRPDHWYSRYSSLHDHRPSSGWRTSREDLEGESGESSDKMPWSKWEDPWSTKLDAEQERMEKEFEKLKKEIESDPYGMVFGRRLEPFSFGRHRHPWSSLFHNMLGFPTEKVDSSSAQSTKKVKWQDPQNEKDQPSVTYDASFEFDPISGRMVEMKSSSEQSGGGIHQTRQESDSIEKSEESSKVSQPVIEVDKSSFSETKTPKNSDQMGDDSRIQTGVGSFEAKSDHAKETEKPNAKDLNGNTVFLMGEPDQREHSSASTSGIDGPKSPANVKTQGAVTGDESPKGPQAIKHEKISDMGARSRSPQAIFSEFKDYITSKLKTENAEESPDTSSWPFSFRPAPVSKARSQDAQPSQAPPHQDPEAQDLEGLRVSDVRGSFKHRVEEKPDASGSDTGTVATAKDPTSGVNGPKMARGATEDVAKPDIPESQPHRSEPDQGSWQATPNEASVATSSREDINSMLGDAIRQTYEDHHRNVDLSSQDGAASASRDSSTQAKGENGESVQATGSPTVSAAGASSSSSSDTGEVWDDAELDKLLVDIEQANNTASALLSQIREGVQAPAPGEAPAQAGPTTPPTEYIVLAYDVMARKVKEASMVSGSSVPFEPLHPADAVTRLYNPSKFLPYFPMLEAQGYELFSGAPEVLVFKRTKVAGSEAVQSPPSSTESSKEDIRGVHSAAPAAELEQDSTDGVESSSQTEPQSSSSSSFSEQDRHPVLGRVFRRMVLGGVAAGGSCYAVGVVIEYFRTGGQDGQGPRGFTGLEGR